MASKGDMVARLKSLSPAQLKAGLKFANEQRTASTFQILKFDGKSGILKVVDGMRETRLDAPELLLDLFQSTQGFICWNKKEVIGEYQRSFFESLPDISTMEGLGPYDGEDDGWQHNYTLFFKDPKTNAQYKLNLSSASGRRQVDALYQKVYDLESLHDFTKQTPIVKITAEPFVSKGFKNYKPIFDIEDWKDNPAEQVAPANPLDAARLAAPAAKGDNVVDAETIPDSVE